VAATRKGKIPLRGTCFRTQTIWRIENCLILTALAVPECFHTRDVGSSRVGLSSLVFSATRIYSHCKHRLESPMDRKTYGSSLRFVELRYQACQSAQPAAADQYRASEG
jgi:hypothetical protein